MKATLTIDGKDYPLELRSDLPKEFKYITLHFEKEEEQKSYQILEFKSNDSNYKDLYLKENGLYGSYGGGAIGMLDCKSILDVDNFVPKGKYYISSVKRLSDGVVFSIGDKMTYKGKEDANWGGSDPRFCEIDSFSLHNGFIYVNQHYLSADTTKDINDWIKHEEKKPLFTTEDGVDIFKGDVCFYVKDTDFSVGTHCNITKKESYPYFSTKEAADNWILLNKPCLSVNEVLNIETDMFDPRSWERTLTNLAKQKLNTK